jgi:hypothetical protein
MKINQQLISMGKSMNFSNTFVGDKGKKMLRDIIEYNADMFEKVEGKSRLEAEYLSICLLLYDISKRLHGNKDRLTVMDMLKNEYSHHHNDVLAYLAVKYG